MLGDISLQKALGLQQALFIDVRSPLEYTRGSIPGSVNIPLFDDREREMIGLAYKENQQRARLKGLAFLSPKLPRIIETIDNLSRSNTIVIYCWRGGMRSRSLSMLLEMLKIPAYRLQKGYRSYRRYILDQLESLEISKPLFVLNGLTGVGKSEVLRLLSQMGCPTVDLEALACHRGSLFGHLGIKEWRSQKDFDALLWKRITELQDCHYLVIEGEGKRIGSIYQPDFLYRAIGRGIHILLTAPLESRADRLLREYTPASEGDRKEIEEALLSIKKYLGTAAVDHLLTFLKEGSYKELACKLCELYYDRLYSDSKPGKVHFDLVVDSSIPQKAALEIKSFIDNFMIIRKENENEYLRPRSRTGQSD